MSRPSVPRRTHSVGKRSSQSEGEFLLDCKAAYIVVLDDIDEPIVHRKQLVDALQQAGRNPSRKTLDKYWTRDTDSITFDEFCDICKREPTTNQDDLIKAFRKIDLNGDGYITNNELFRVMTTRGEKMTKDEVQAIIDEVDENGDGKLDYQEFCNMLLSTQGEVHKLARQKLERNKKGERRGKEEQSSRKTNDRMSRDRDTSNKQAVASLRPRLPEPKKLKDWSLVEKKGCFFVEEEGTIVNHQYRLTVKEATSIWITIEPQEIRGITSISDKAPIDTMLFVLRERADREGNKLVTFTTHRDEKGKYGVRCDLERGRYMLCPFTTGCRFKRRAEEPNQEVKLIKKSKEGDRYVITKPFRDALKVIFDMCDLDGNGLMSRNELNWYNLRTSDEGLGDEEWAVVQEKIDLENDELTQKGFMQLIQMEADDNDGDPEDLWVNLSSMGFNKNLELDEGAPFLIQVYAEDSEPTLEVRTIDDGGEDLQNAVAQSVIKKGDSNKIKGMRDLFLHTFVNDFRASFVVENKSHSDVKIVLDCEKSKNCESSRGKLRDTVKVSAETAVVGHHLLPKNERLEWSIACAEEIH